MFVCFYRRVLITNYSMLAWWVIALLTIAPPVGGVSTSVCEIDHCATCGPPETQCKQCYGEPAFYAATPVPGRPCTDLTIFYCAEYEESISGDLTCVTCGENNEYVPSINGTTCLNCANQIPGCERCVRDSFGNLECIDCGLGYIVDNGVCVCMAINALGEIVCPDTCPTGQGTKLDNSGCSSCFFIDAFCESCYSDGTDNEPNKCRSCVEGFFTPRGKSCVECGTRILNCVTCVDRNGDSNPETCSECADGSVPSADDTICISCWNLLGFDCVQCSGTVEDPTCTYCGTSLDVTTDGKGCIDCDSYLDHCLRCADTDSDGEADTCSECDYTFNLLDDVCQDCTGGDPQCTQCEFYAVCGECNPGYNLTADATACVPTFEVTTTVKPTTTAAPTTTVVTTTTTVQTTTEEILFVTTETVSTPGVTTTSNGGAVTTTSNGGAVTTTSNDGGVTSTSNSGAVTTTSNGGAVTTTSNDGGFTTTSNGSNGNSRVTNSKNGGNTNSNNGGGTTPDVVTTGSGNSNSNNGGGTTSGAVTTESGNTNSNTGGGTTPDVVTTVAGNNNEASTSGNRVQTVQATTTGSGVTATSVGNGTGGNPGLGASTGDAAGGGLQTWMIAVIAVVAVLVVAAAVVGLVYYFKFAKRKPVHPEGPKDKTYKADEAIAAKDSAQQFSVDTREKTRVSEFTNDGDSPSRHPLSRKTLPPLHQNISPRVTEPSRMRMEPEEGDSSAEENASPLFTKRHVGMSAMDIPKPAPRRALPPLETNYSQRPNDRQVEPLSARETKNFRKRADDEMFTRNLSAFEDVNKNAARGSDLDYLDLKPPSALPPLGRSSLPPISSLPPLNPSQGTGFKSKKKSKQLPDLY